MDKVTKVAVDSIRSYYNSLFTFGYSNYVNVDNLLILTFLEELLDYDSQQYIDEKDYNDIIRALYNLTGNACNIDYPSYAAYINQSTQIRADKSGNFRLSEQSIFRVKA